MSVTLALSNMLREGSELWSAMRDFPEAWIETTGDMSWEMLCALPPAARSSLGFCNMCHDDILIQCYTEYENEVAQCVQREFDSAMQWVIKVIPVSDGDWKSMIVGSWAAK